MSQSRPGRPRGARATLLLTLLLVLCACGGAADSERSAEQASPAPVQTGPAPEPVQITGAPDGVEVGEPESADDLSSGVYFVSQVYPVTGPALERPVLITIELDTALPEGTPLVVAARSDEDDPWEFLEGRLDTDGRHVELIATELARFGVLALDEASVRRSWSAELDAALEGDAARPQGVEEPTCESTEAARDDGAYRAKASRGRTVLWCLDLVGEQRVLRVTNPRGVPVRVRVPGATSSGPTGDPARPRLGWDTWLDVVGTGTPSDTPLSQGSDASGVDTFLAPGRTLVVDVDLEPRSRLVLTASDDARGQAVQLLHAMARATAAQVRGLGQRRADPARLLADWAGRKPCRTALDTTGESVGAALVKGCLGARALTRSFGTTALVLGPTLGDRRTRSEVTQRAASLAEGTRTQRVQVRRAAPDFSALTGRYAARGRTLVVDEDGRVVETVTQAGAAVITLTYRLAEPDVDGARTVATLTDVQVGERSMIEGAVPSVGATGTLALVEGVVTSPFLQRSYCGPATRETCRAADAKQAAAERAAQKAEQAAEQAAAKKRAEEQRAEKKRAERPRRDRNG